MSNVLWLVWLISGLIGGYTLNRIAELAGVPAWFMAMLLGPITLVIALLERLDPDMNVRR